LFPGAIFVSPSADVYVVDMYNHRIQAWYSPSYSVGITVAGHPHGVPGSDADKLYFPSGVFVDPVQSVFVFDHGNSRVQRWAFGATIGTTVVAQSGAANGTFNIDPNVPLSGGSSYNFTSVYDLIHYPSGVFKSPNNIYTTDFNFPTVQQRQTTGTVVR